MLFTPITIQSQIRLTQDQFKAAIQEYLQRNGVSVESIGSISLEEGQRGDPQGLKLDVVLGGSKPGPTFRGDGSTAAIHGGGRD